MPGPLDQKLTGVLGDRTAKALGRALDLHTVGDLVTHYPRRYQKRGELTRLDALPLETEVTVVADVLRAGSRSMMNRRGSRQEVLISDGSGTLTLVFFNQPFRVDPSKAGALKPGVRGMFSGRVRFYKGMRELTHPRYELFDGSGDEPPDPEVDPEGAKAWHEVPIPIYPASAAIDTWNIRKAVALALENIAGIEDPMPLEICRTAKLMGYEPALRRIHQPQHDGDWMQAKRTLRYHEAFLLQTALLQRRAIRAMFAATPRTPQPGGLLARFDAALPFELTDDQRLVGTEIAEDLAGQVPMHRLLQGEVASGKTLVALRAMLAVAESGGQSALLAPTEVLAAQHLRSIAATLGPDLAAELMPTLVTGQLPAAERRRAALRLVTGQARIVVGTHALLSESTEFYDLGLVVVDEQHRFGVEQREVLRRKGSAPHTAGHDGDPDPAHRGDDGVRGPGDLHDPAPAEGARTDRDASWCRWPRSRTGCRTCGAGRGRDRPGPAGLRALPGDRRRRDHRPVDRGRRRRPARAATTPARWPRSRPRCRSCARIRRSPGGGSRPSPDG